MSTPAMDALLKELLKFQAQVNKDTQGFSDLTHVPMGTDAHAAAEQGFQAYQLVGQRTAALIEAIKALDQTGYPQLPVVTTTAAADQEIDVHVGAQKQASDIVTGPPAPPQNQEAVSGFITGTPSTSTASGKK
jgi:CheY-like chemotaxis protein